MHIYLRGFSGLWIALLLAMASTVNTNDVQSQTNDSALVIDSLISNSSNGITHLPDLDLTLPKVNGTYINNVTGFSITLPNNWTGNQINFLHDMVMVSPYSIDLTTGDEPETVMMINSINNEIYNQISDSINTSPTNISSEADGTNTPDLQSPEDEYCDPEVPKIITINNLKAEQSRYICTVGASTIITEAYAFATSDNSVILVGFTASEDEFNKYLQDFENSVRSIKIFNPDDIAKSTLYANYKKLIK